MGEITAVRPLFLEAAQAVTQKAKPKEELTIACGV